MQEVGEELGHVPELVRLQPVDGRVLLREDLLEVVLSFLYGFIHKSIHPSRQTHPHIHPWGE